MLNTRKFVYYKFVYEEDGYEFTQYHRSTESDINKVKAELEEEGYKVIKIERL